MGEGFGRRPRHAHRAGSRRAPTRPAAGAWSTSTPARPARTRWSPPSTSAATAWAARPRRSTPPCTAWSLLRTSITSTPTAASPSPRRPTASGSPRTSSATGSSWVPWRRPGFQLGLDIAAVHDDQPAGRRRDPRRPRHHRVGRHQRRGRSELACGSSRRLGAYIDAHGDAEPFGAGASRNDDRSARRNGGSKAAALAPHLRAHRFARTSAWSATSPTPTSCSSSSPARSCSRSPSSAPRAPTTSCAPRSSRSCSTSRLTHRSRSASNGWPSCTSSTAPTTRAYYDRHATPGLATDARRRPGDHPGARRRHVLLRQGQADRTRRRRVLRQRHQRDARRRGHLDLRADPRVGEVPHRVLGARGGEAPAAPEAQAPRRPHRAGDRRGERHRPRHRRRSSPRTGRASWSPISTVERRPSRRGRARQPPTSPSGSPPTSPTRTRCATPSTRTLLAFGGIDLVVNNAGLSISKPLLETTEARLGPPARRDGEGQLPRRRRPRREAMIDQRLGGDIVYIVSKNAVFAGPNNVAYSAAKADQAHQVRLLAAELGEHGIRVNGVNPDGVVRGSGIFAGGWGAQRAAVYGVPEDELGAFYAATHAAQARGAARSTWPTRVAVARARTSSATPPACSSPSTPASPPRSSADAPTPVFAAVDLGASGGRVMAGTVDDDRRHAPGRPPLPQRVDRARRASPLGLHRPAIARCVRRPCASSRMPVSIGIDTWGVDYGLLDEDGDLLAEPIAYRDDRTAEVIDEVHALVAPEELYAINGLQFLPFNTIYQLAAEQRGPSWPRAAHIVLLPDLIAYLSDRRAAHRAHERVDHRPPRRSHPHLVDRCSSTVSTSPASCSRRCRTPGEPPRHRHGPAPPVVDRRFPRHRVGGGRRPGHHRAFRLHLVSGTWSLVGLELDAPVLTPDAFKANFTNELGVDGRTRFLRNVGGLWLLQECLRAWATRATSSACSLKQQRLPAGGPTHRCRRPGLHPAGRYAGAHRRRGRRRPWHPPASRAASSTHSRPSYARTVRQAAELSGRSVEVVHIVGGGSQNRPVVPAHRRRLPTSRPGRTGRGHGSRQHRGPSPCRRCALRLAGSAARSWWLRPSPSRGTSHREPLRDPALRRPLRTHRDRPSRTPPGTSRLGRRPAPHREAPPARAACSTTSTARPRTSARSPPTSAAFADRRRSGHASCAA